MEVNFMAKNMNFVTYYDEEGNLKTLTADGGGGNDSLVYDSGLVEFIRSSGSGMSIPQRVIRLTSLKGLSRLEIDIVSTYFTYKGPLDVSKVAPAEHIVRDLSLIDIAPSYDPRYPKDALISIYPAGGINIPTDNSTGMNTAFTLIMGEGYDNDTYWYSSVGSAVPDRHKLYIRVRIYK